jgi:hypothetical protein
MANKSTVSGRIKAHFLIVLALVIGVVGGYGCQKAVVEPHASARVPSEAMRTTFEVAGYAHALVRPLGDTTELCWVPNWENSYDKTGTDGLRYTYVPLTAKLRSTRTQRWRDNFAMKGARSFVVVQHGSETDNFTLATYLDAPLDGTPAAKRRGAIKATQPPFSNFSGNLLLQGLSTTQFARFTYRNGQVVHQGSEPTKSQTGESTSTTNGFECVNYYTCYWTAACDYAVIGSITNGVNGCDPPWGEACNGSPNGGYGVEWRYNGSSVNPQCTYVPDPPTNPDPNPGGGGDDNNNVSVESNATYLVNNPTALFPCAFMAQSWQSLIQFKPSAAIIQKLYSASNQADMNFGGMQLTWDFYVQSIANARGTLVNMDNHTMYIAKLPVINGQQTTLQSFADYLRLNLSTTSGTDFVPSTSTGQDEAAIWNSSNPVGAVLNIFIPGDPGAVICSDYYSNRSQVSWTFTTLHVPLLQNHPVSGTRTFSLSDMGNGYYFTTAGTDRLTSKFDDTVGWLTDLVNGGSTTDGENGFQFKKGDALWEKELAGVGSILTPQGITFSIVPYIAYRPPYEAIRTALRNGQSISTVVCP